MLSFYFVLDSMEYNIKQHLNYGVWLKIRIQPTVIKPNKIFLYAPRRIFVNYIFNEEYTTN